MNSTTFPAQPGGTARSALDLLKLQILYPNLSSEERLSPSQHLPVPAGPSAAMRCPLIRYELMIFTGSAKKVSKQTVPDVALWTRFYCVRPTSAHGCRELLGRTRSRGRTSPKMLLVTIPISAAVLSKGPGSCYDTDFCFRFPIVSLFLASLT